MPHKENDSEDCTNCKFYGNGFEKDEGFCFRYPPFSWFRTTEGKTIYLQPEVGEGTWCGEYKPESPNK